MKHYYILLLLLLWSCKEENRPVTIASPSNTIRVTFTTTENGQPVYAVHYNNSAVIQSSTMGFTFQDNPTFSDSIVITDVFQSEHDETWEMPWGEQAEVQNTYTQCVITLQEIKKPYRTLKVIFRVFDDGVGFRYGFPSDFAPDSVKILDENTEFNLHDDPLVWWTPGDWDIYEHLYRSTRLSEINAIQYRNHNNLAQSYIPNNAVNTPVTMKSDGGIYLSFLRSKSHRLCRDDLGH